MEPADRERWVIDAERSVIAFKVRHLMVATARGRFRRFQGEVRRDPHEVNRSEISVDVDLSSVDTGQADRDDNLRTELFLTAQFPQMAFRSTTVRTSGVKRLFVEGALSVRGVTRLIGFDAERTTSQGPGEGFRARFTLNRRDFGLVWSPAIETGGIAVGDKVEVELDVWLQPAAAQ